MPRFLLIGLMALCTGCGAIAERAVEEVAEQAIESEAGENVDIDLDTSDGTMVIGVEGEDGEPGEIVIGGTEIPEDFPVPVPDGGQVQGTIAAGEGGGMATIMYPADRWEFLVAFFDDWAAPFSDVLRSDTAEPLSASWITDQGKAAVTLSEADGQIVLFIVTN